MQTSKRTEITFCTSACILFTTSPLQTENPKRPVCTMWMLFVLCIASVIACTSGRINALCLVLMAMPCVAVAVAVAAQAYYSTLLSVKDHIVWKIVIVLSLHTLISQLPSLQCVNSHESNILTAAAASSLLHTQWDYDTQAKAALAARFWWIECEIERTPPRCASLFYCCCCCGWL